MENETGPETYLSWSAERDLADELMSVQIPEERTTRNIRRYYQA